MPLLGWVEIEPEFFEDFARASRLTVEYQGRVIGTVTGREHHERAQKRAERYYKV